jgi:hypothetical protein
MAEKKQPIKANYRIGNGRHMLAKIEPNPGFRSPQPAKVKPHLRYSGQEIADTKVVLLNTVIEEHLLKFGFIQTFDTFIKEAADLVAAKKAIPKENIMTGQELKDKLIDVHL